MPAPPLRTIYHRVSSNERNGSFSDENVSDFDILSTKAPKHCDTGSAVSTFKLADEAQMGGLSSLMAITNNNDKCMANNMQVDDDKDEEKGN